jgi:hypothetical protein
VYLDIRIDPAVEIVRDEASALVHMHTDLVWRLLAQSCLVYVRPLQREHENKESMRTKRA